MKKRVITFFWLTPLILGVAWLGNPWFALVFALASLLAVREFYRLISLSGGTPFPLWGMLLTLLFFLSPILPLSFSVILAFSLLSCLALSLFFKNPLGWIWTLVGALYVGWLLSYLLALREWEMGREWVILGLVTTIANDTFALLTGKALGHHHLAPSISPGKTWEGGVGGILAAVIACLSFSYILNLPLNFKWAILLGLLISIFAQIGDLAESSLKRRAGVKDSGWLLPGMGGVLDRSDSIIFVSPLIYYYVIWLT